jgi:hypothetical protein
MDSSTVLSSEPVLLDTTSALTKGKVATTIKSKFLIRSDGQAIDYFFLRQFSNQADISERTATYNNAGILPAGSVNKLHKFVGVFDDLRHHAAFVEINSTVFG